jgi:transcriptional regulator with XRE-family HTH domain
MTPKFIRTTIPEKESLGEKLSKKRNSLHLDLKEIEKAIKIPARHLSLLEEGRYEKLLLILCERISENIFVISRA